jgi:general secretion pathway protein I
MARRASRGFTLVETLVALAILAGVALAAYSMTAQSARFAAVEQDRLIAGIIADNAMTGALIRPLAPQAGEESEEIEMAGRKWLAKRTVSEAGEDLLRIEIAVSAQGQVLARVEALRPAP